MEYDRAKASGPPEANNFPHESVKGGQNEGLLRVKGSDVDVSPLNETITFPFSGRTAKNRFLKAPMTERLCHWNKDGEDISARGFPSDEYQLLYRRWGEGEIGVIVAGNLMLKYDAVEAFGACDPFASTDPEVRVGILRRLLQISCTHLLKAVADLVPLCSQATQSCQTIMTTE